MVSKYLVHRRYGDSNSRTYTEEVKAWDFTIVADGVLVFNDRKRTRAYRDWIKVEEIG